MKAARVNRNLTQSQAGLEIGVSKDTIGKWERNECVPNVKYIPAIEKAYGIKYDDIIFLPSRNA